jgi:hypothetical protein
MSSRASAALAAAALALAVALLAVAAPRVSRPGLYYDEAFMAQQAKDFFEPGRGFPHPGSTREIALFGRPFPLRNAVYLGATKSQLLIPVFAVFGADVRVLRLASLATAAAALGLAMLAAGRLMGVGPALLLGVLVAADPTFLFLSLYEWGPFTTLLLCRTGALLLFLVGWQRRALSAFAASGLLAGIGVFTRADFAVVVAACALAATVAAPERVREALRERRGALAAFALAAALGASPMLLTLQDVLATAASPVVAQRGALAEKLAVTWSLLDGSHFHRLQAAGGRFDRLFEVSAPFALFGALAAAVLLAAPLWLRGDAARRLRPAGLFALLAGVLATAGTAALPGAVRAHHLLNGFPFVHWAAAAALAALWGRHAAGTRARGLSRAGVVSAVAVVVASGISVSRATFALVERTGGRGRWSDALAVPAAELDARPQSRGVSLDWGFHEPLGFLTRRAALEEPIWGVREAVRRDGEWRIAGAAGDLYLVHDRDYDLFGLGPPFLAAAQRLAAEAPGALAIREHRDREGAVAFLSVRIDRDHTIRFRRRFHIELDPPHGIEPAAPGG